MLSALLGDEDQDDLDLRVVIKSGDIKDEICAAIREAKADIVVMGTHGRGLFGRLLIGSITEGLLRQVSIPVLTICHVVQPREFKRILFATDLSAGSEQAFEFALEFAGKVHSDLVILHAIHNVSLDYEGVGILPDVNAYGVDEAKARLAAFRAGADRSRLKAETIVVEDVPADAILKAADEQVPDLILIAVQKKGLVERALLGTTAERVVREAKVPVLCVPVSVATVQEQVATTESGKSAPKA
jgi:nucleotide-binding universal stress UspA family protein